MYAQFARVLRQRNIGDGMYVYCHASDMFYTGVWQMDSAWEYETERNGFVGDVSTSNPERFKVKCADWRNSSCSGSVS